MSRLLRLAGWTVFAIVLVATLAYAWAARPVPIDAFYSATLPAGAAAGTLLAYEPFAQAVPPRTRAWRIRYATTNARGEAVAATALVAHAADAAPGPRPIVAWAHGTTGVEPACAPSAGATPFGAPGLERALATGWLWVAPDYPGLGTPGTHEYLVGAGEARAVLDAIRAARRLPGTNAGAKAVIWGHSQGGHAALWAGILAPAYAPDAGVIGVAAAAPATDLPELTAHVQYSVAGRILNAYLLRAYEATYPDVRFDDWSPGVRGAFARRASRGCLEGRTALVALANAAVIGGSIFARDPRGGALGRRLVENSPTQRIDAPVFVAQGAADELVLPSIQERFVAARCRAGQVLEYARYAGRDHLSLVAPDSPFVPELVAWTHARFDGAPAPVACGGRRG